MKRSASEKRSNGRSIEVLAGLACTIQATFRSRNRLAISQSRQPDPVLECGFGDTQAFLRYRRPLHFAVVFEPIPVEKVEDDYCIECSTLVRIEKEWVTTDADWTRQSQATYAAEEAFRHGGQSHEEGLDVSGAE